LIVIRRRLTTQGNGQATLDHERTPLPGAKRRAGSESGPATWTSP